MSVDLSGNVLVSLERLHALEALEAGVPAMLEKAKEEANKERFSALRAKDAADPEAHRKRTKDWKATNKEAYNAKRREQYKLKKMAVNPPGVGGAAAPDA